MLKQKRALEELPAVQTGTQDEMSLEQSARLAEKRKEIPWMLKSTGSSRRPATNPNAALS